MYMSNLVLGLVYAKARNVRRKDVFLDGILAGMVRSPAMGLVLVSALSPGQERRFGGAAPVISSAVASSKGHVTTVTITGQNFAPVPATSTSGGAVAPAPATVTFQYTDRGIATTLSFGNQVVISPTSISLDIPNSREGIGVIKGPGGIACRYGERNNWLVYERTASACEDIAAKQPSVQTPQSPSVQAKPRRGCVPSLRKTTINAPGVYRPWVQTFGRCLKMEPEMTK